LVSSLLVLCSAVPTTSKSHRPWGAAGAVNAGVLVSPAELVVAGGGTGTLLFSSAEGTERAPNPSLSGE